MIFARLSLDEGDQDEDGPSGIRERALLDTFEDGFQLVSLDRGETGVEGKPPWPSAWFLFRRL